MTAQNSYQTQLSIPEAIEVVKRHAKAPTYESVPLMNGLGRTLAHDLASLVDHPSCDNSALDGFACRAQDTLTASEAEPVQLHIVGDIPAGSTFSGCVGPGEAVSIYTGAPVPEGADAIIAVENTARAEDTVLLHRPARPQDIRYRAQDIEVGKVYLSQGLRLTPAAVGVAASMGHAELPVVKRPRIGILATGDEVIEPGHPIRDGQVYNSNSYSVASLVLQAGGEPVMLPRAVDDPQVLRDTLANMGGVDLLVTSGGVSMGNYDFVRDLLLEEGHVHFWKVAMRPGGPALFGQWQDTPVFGLPGNPVSSMVVFMLITQAWIAASLGSTQSIPYYNRIKAKADSAHKGAGFKEAFRRATLEVAEDGYTWARTTGDQSSGILTSMLYGQGLVVVPPHKEINAGEWVEVIPLA